MRFLAPILAVFLALAPATAQVVEMSPPRIGDHALRILTPTMLELEYVASVDKPTQLPSAWNFVTEKGTLVRPAPEAFVVSAGSRKIPVKQVGFKRRPLYAPIQQWDLRLGNWIYLELSQPLRENETVTVELPKLPAPDPAPKFEATFSQQRTSPVIHANQVGYQTGKLKVARAGFFLGSLGELDLGSVPKFYVRARSGKIVFEGVPRVDPDRGFKYATKPYQRVLELDFTKVDEPGSYVVGIPGIGESLPFRINDGYFANVARTYALGIYHQRSGSALTLPFTRFCRSADHTAPAAIPDGTAAFAKSEKLVKKMSNAPNKNQKAPHLDSYDTSLSPIVKTRTIDVSGGHLDAGDYSKYTTNSALFVHHLTFANDALPGVAELDNLGLPESRDGLGDLLQLAAYEAAFLSKMQDDDGGFFFLVYPRDRAYELDVTPDEGDPQIVFPKNTAATASGGAALAQLSSSPSFRKEFPKLSRKYLSQAKLAWTHLQALWKKHGEDGAYQRISHYGDEFMDRDEAMWLATELFLATGEDQYHTYIRKRFRPNSPESKKWSWYGMFAGYGAATRSYAFSGATGRIPESKLDGELLTQSKRAVVSRAEEIRQWTDESAYGVAFPTASKRHRAIGWHFATADTFDLATADALLAKDTFLPTMLTNIDFDLGANPHNTVLLTGLGHRRHFQIVHQWAMNNDAILPQSGIPIGSLQTGFSYNHTYQKTLGTLTFPSDGAEDRAYGFYDRWGDAYNLSTEFVTTIQARALAATAYLMAKTPLRTQKYTPLSMKIETSGESLTAKCAGRDLSTATVLWDMPGIGKVLVGTTVRVAPQGTYYVEATWPDGQRAHAIAQPGS